MLPLRKHVGKVYNISFIYILKLSNLSLKIIVYKYLGIHET